MDKAGIPPSSTSSPLLSLPPVYTVQLSFVVPLHLASNVTSYVDGLLRGTAHVASPLPTCESATTPKVVVGAVIGSGGEPKVNTPQTSVGSTVEDVVKMKKRLRNYHKNLRRKARRAAKQACRASARSSVEDSKEQCTGSTTQPRGTPGAACQDLPGETAVEVDSSVGEGNGNLKTEAEQLAAEVKLKNLRLQKCKLDQKLEKLNIKESKHSFVEVNGLKVCSHCHQLYANAKWNRCEEHMLTLMVDRTVKPGGQYQNDQGEWISNNSPKRIRVKARVQGVCCAEFNDPDNPCPYLVGPENLTVHPSDVSPTQGLDPLLCSSSSSQSHTGKSGKKYLRKLGANARKNKDIFDVDKPRNQKLRDESRDDEVGNVHALVG